MHAAEQTETARITPADRRAGAIAALISAVVWITAALWHPTTTYHLAPALVAAAWPVTYRVRSRVATTIGSAVTAAAGASVIAVTTTVLLAARHALDGPTVTGSDAVVAETILMIGIGAVSGFVTAVWRRR
ncbi:MULTISPECIES: hypothetical protein [unclassified Nocardia]|uniref:hypothetical protein n=1 Tax=unclassified Nocardia TaxID=2637762 RepID=UPI00278C53A2|nr:MULTISPECIES: hypothetical protein [unclassified Nocardia]